MAFFGMTAAGSVGRWPPMAADGVGRCWPASMAGGVLFVDPGATWREVSPEIAGHVATGGGSGGHVAERGFVARQSASLSVALLFASLSVAVAAHCDMAHGVGDQCSGRPFEAGIGRVAQYECPGDEDYGGYR